MSLRHRESWEGGRGGWIESGEPVAGAYAGGCAGQGVRGLPAGPRQRPEEVAAARHPELTWNR